MYLWAAGVTGEPLVDIQSPDPLWISNRVKETLRMGVTHRPHVICVHQQHNIFQCCLVAGIVRDLEVFVS